MSIAPSYSALAAKTDDELIAAHDEIATHTQVGHNFYRDELNRRAQDRATAAALTEARAARKLAIAIIAVVVAIVAITTGAAG